MDKIGLITSPLSSGHATRGVGFYTKNLLAHIQQLAAKFNFDLVEVNDPEQLKTSDFALCHFPFFDLFSPTLPVNESHKTVVTIHDVVPLEFPDIYRPGLKGNLNLWRQKSALQKVSAVITDSQASLNSIQKYLSVPNRKLKLIYLAASKHFKVISNKSTLAAISKKYQLPKEFVLYVGDVNWNKNIPALLRACRIANLPLVWVGKQAMEIESMETRHSELAHVAEIKLLLDNNVFRLGFVPDEDLVGLYNLARVYCQASFAEGFGLPVLEALACGTAVACSKTHSLPEIAGEYATYFDPQNDQDIARAILASKKVDAKKHVSKFSWEKTSRETLQVYRECLDTRSST